MRILIPSCVQLDDRQKEVLQKFGDSLGEQKEVDTDCCGTGHTFEICGSSLGDSISIRHGKRRVNLGYDDDGNILGEME